MRITLKPRVELPNKRPYNNSTKHRAVMDTTFDKHHGDGKMGWLEPGRECVASPAFVVWQSEKGRVVMDIHGLNAAVWKDPYPMPRQEDILHALKGCHWLTTLDLTAAFMQRALHKDSQHLVTVVTHRGFGIL
jgi:succinylglutamate desuccinylase